jgi:hypothetical protein
MIKSSILKKALSNKLFVFTFLLVLSFVTYGSILSNTFFSDDFDVMKRLVVDKQFWIAGFFRPLSDITLLLCYSIGGMNAWIQYLFNILCFSGCSFFIYLFCLRYFKEDKNVDLIAISAAILFVIYPFHAEPVVWAVGRASLLAGFFGLLSLVIAFSDMPFVFKVLLTNICYFIGLLGYESIFMLPMIVIVLMYKKNQPLKNYGIWIVSFTGTFVLHLAARIIFSGYVFGNYQKDAFSVAGFSYVINFFKSVCRLLVFPTFNASTFIFCSICVFIAVAFIAFLSYKTGSRKTEFLKVFFRYAIAILLSLLIPAVFNLSIKTSEGDRLLFFPSVFVVILISYVLCELLIRRRLYFSFCLILAGYFSSALFINLSNWNKASSVISVFLKTSKNNEHNSKRTVILNLPDSYYGAYIFRNGFKGSLLLNNIDTAKIDYIARFMIWDYDSTPDTLKPVCENKQLSIDNFCSISSENSPNEFSIAFVNGLRYTVDTTKNDIWFWDKHTLKKLNLCDVRSFE